jgi:hypothetical protein
LFLVFVSKSPTREVCHSLTTYRWEIARMKVALANMCNNNVVEEGIWSSQAGSVTLPHLQAA